MERIAESAVAVGARKRRQPVEHTWFLSQRSVTARAAHSAKDWRRRPSWRRRPGLAGVDAGHEGSTIVLLCSGSACCREWPRAAISWPSSLTACFFMSQHSLMSNRCVGVLMFRAVELCEALGGLLVAQAHATQEFLYLAVAGDARRVPLSRAIRAQSSES